MYQNELSQMNEDLQKIEHHILITQQENRRLGFQWEEKQQEIKDHQLRIERENQLREQKQAKAAQEAAAKAKKEKKAEKKKRKETERSSGSNHEDKNGRSLSLNDEIVKEKKKSNQKGFEDGFNNAADIDAAEETETKLRKASVNSAARAGSNDYYRESHKNDGGDHNRKRSNSREADHRFASINQGDDGRYMNNGRGSPLVRRNSFADQSQTDLEIRDENKIDLKSSYQGVPEHYYNDGRASSIYSNGPNTFTAKDEIFTKFSTRTVSTAAKLDEEVDNYDVPDIMGIPMGRSESANGADRMRDSQYSGRAGGRSGRSRHIRRPRTKTTFQKDGASGLHKDNGCCHDQQCSIF